MDYISTVHFLSSENNFIIKNMYVGEAEVDWFVLVMQNFFL